MWLKQGTRFATVALAVGMLVGVGVDQAMGQGYSGGSGGYYANPEGGYYYPSYAYGYQTSTGATLPSGYYAYPNGNGGYYYQYFAPGTQAARPTSARPAARPSAIASQPSPASARELALEARIRRLEARFNSVMSTNSARANANSPAVPSYTYDVPGNPNIQRDARYPNYSFDYSSWIAHNL